MGSPAPTADTPTVAPLPPWDMYTVVVALFSGYILIPLLASNIVTLADPFLSDARQLLVEQATTLLTWVGIFLLLRWRYGRFSDYVGLKPTRPWRYYLWESLQLLTVSCALTLIMQLAWRWSGIGENAPEPYQNLSHQELVVIAGFAVLMAPILEELIFRGLIQSTFHKLTSPWLSVVLTSLVFLALHGSYFDNIKALTQVTVLGLCFGLWRERTRSLIPGMVVHWLNNGLVSYLMLTTHRLH